MFRLKSDGLENKYANQNMIIELVDTKYPSKAEKYDGMTLSGIMFASG
jgi:hypothetical protein